MTESAAVLTAGRQAVGPATELCMAPHPSVPVLVPAENELLGHVGHPRAASAGALLRAGSAAPRRQSWEEKNSLSAQQKPQILAVYRVGQWTSTVQASNRGRVLITNKAKSH